MDTFMRGAVAGLIAGIGKDIWTLASKYLGFGEISFIDWMAVMEFGRLPNEPIHLILATFSHLIILSALGVGFAYLVPHIETGFIVAKGIMYSLIVGTVLYVIPILFKMPYIGRPGADTALSNLIGSIIYGALLAVLLSRLSNRAVR